MKKVTVLILAFTLMAFYVVNSYSAAEKDPLASRIPADQIASAKAMKNPFPNSPANVAKGKELFQGKA
ncbi:MAG TPA: cytochrome c class I, partial [Nitrospiria bacterium]|nr:cytochrome c class I [Nitrospiria bacterium]